MKKVWFTCERKILRLGIEINYQSKKFHNLSDLRKKSLSIFQRKKSRMCSGSGEVHWSVFVGVKLIAATPEALMAEIESAISNLEYSRAAGLLDADEGYDAGMAGEAYKAGCAALAAGKLDEALRSLNLSLSKCPPEKTSAIAKLHFRLFLFSQNIFVQTESIPFYVIRINFNFQNDAMRPPIPNCTDVPFWLIVFHHKT
ncbi:hypothetical protein RJT34_19830 [Clitoria ternatea]|uniref:Uncharacterized protein n=1 Tax=Clitoria ternatea TaxID=43366 RepID=A0AAN9IRR8_CLITE